jgi:hypothetical protein
VLKSAHKSSFVFNQAHIIDLMTVSSDPKASVGLCLAERQPHRKPLIVDEQHDFG